jgi:hypothetical protein
VKNFNENVEINYSIDIQMISGKFYRILYTSGTNSSIEYDLNVINIFADESIFYVSIDEGHFKLGANGPFITLTGSNNLYHLEYIQNSFRMVVKESAICLPNKKYSNFR